MAAALFQGPVFSGEGPKVLAGFDFKDGQLEKGFGSFQYSDIGTNPCKLYRGHDQSYLCGRDENGNPLSIKVHYLEYNNDHMGWMRWGYMDAEDRIAVKGGSLKLVLTGGAYDRDGEVAFSGKPVKAKSQFFDWTAQGIDPLATIPLPGDASLFFKTHSATASFTAFQGKNRLVLWVLMTKTRESGFDRQQARQNYPRPDFTFSFYPFIDDSRGGHYYHGVSNIPMGGWTKIEFDGHPFHHNGGDKNSYSHYRAGGYEAPGNGKEYFERITTFALRARVLSGQKSPADIFIDEITALNTSFQNEETISSMGIGFDPEKKRFDISFSDKYRCLTCSAAYEARYSFSPITQANFADARRCRVINFNREMNNDNGVVHKPNNGYNQIWAGLRLRAGDEAKLRTGAKIYFAVQDISDRSHLGERDPWDDQTLAVPGAGRVKRSRLIRTMAYTIFPVNRPLAFEGKKTGYRMTLGEASKLTFSARGGTPPYVFYAGKDLPQGLFLKTDGSLTGKPGKEGDASLDLFVVDSRNHRVKKRVTIEVRAPEICGDGLDNDMDGRVDCEDPDCMEKGDCSRLLVDFGAAPEKNRFGVSGWDQVVMDRYTGYLGKGTTIMTGRNPSYDYQGVKGPVIRLEKGSRILVYWVNRSDEPVHFIPRISFEEDGRPANKDRWARMSEVNIGPGETGISRYQVTSDPLRTGLINVNVNFSHNRAVVCDKIILVP